VIFAVIDANAKLPSGVLNGNLNQLGDFDQCLNVISSNKKFKGQYCLASIQLSLPKKFKNLDRLRKTVLAGEAYKSDFDDVCKNIEMNLNCILT
jgi:Nose resistant-to-fluoxetine protein, N-terminal domain